MNFHITHDPNWCNSLAIWANEKYSPSFTNAAKIVSNLSKLGEFDCADWQRNLDLIADAIKPARLEGEIKINITNIKEINLLLVLILTVTLSDNSSYNCVFTLTPSLHLCAIHSVNQITQAQINKPSERFALVELGKTSKPSFLFECSHNHSNANETEEDESSDDEDDNLKNQENETQDEAAMQEKVSSNTNAFFFKHNTPSNVQKHSPDQLNARVLSPCPLHIISFSNLS